MSTTYKPALLKAIVRLQRQGPTLELALSAIANSFVALYWTLTVVFHLRQAATLAKEPEVLQKIRRAATAANTRRLSDLSIANRESLAKSIVATLRIDALIFINNSRAYRRSGRTALALIHNSKLPHMQVSGCSFPSPRSLGRMGSRHSSGNLAFPCEEVTRIYPMF